VSCDPFKDPVPRTKPRANEKLWELFKGHDIYACELKYHGEFGVEAQIFKNAELLVGYRHQTRWRCSGRNANGKTLRRAAREWMMTPYVKRKLSFSSRDWPLSVANLKSARSRRRAFVSRRRIVDEWVGAIAEQIRNWGNSFLAEEFLNAHKETNRLSRQLFNSS
jgi:hypothetical protein